jgi:site-specific DNA-cytosine methylase
MKTFASLFTGGGLADIGALQAGYELLWGVERDADIAAVANANLPHRDTVHAASVIGFDWGNVERPDHLHMSPPCQDFSVAKISGKVGNDNDGLADACIEALAALQPSTVTLENVEGYRKAPGFQRIVDYLWGADYWVNVDVLNSADFGVPQTRRRLFLRAVHGGFPGPLPQPVKWRGWYEAIEDLIPELRDSPLCNWQKDRVTLDGWALVGNQGDDASQRSIDQPSFTIVSTEKSNSAYRVKTPDGMGLKLGIQGMARIQSVPRWYDCKNAKIIGNGVPCLMMQRVMESFCQEASMGCFYCSWHNSIASLRGIARPHSQPWI